MDISSQGANEMALSYQQQIAEAEMADLQGAWCFRCADWTCNVCSECHDCDQPDCHLFHDASTDCDVCNPEPAPLPGFLPQSYFPPATDEERALFAKL